MADTIAHGVPRSLVPQGARGWTWLSTAKMPRVPNMIDVAAFCHGSRHDTITVISAVEIIEGHPEWHVSISLQATMFGADGMPIPRRAPEAVIRKVFADFGMDGHGFDEDNHAGANAAVRNFWLACAPDRRGVCACKADEPAVSQPFGDTGGDGGGVYVHRDEKGES